MSNIAIIREQVRMIVDPLIIRLRQELYGDGVTYANHIREGALPPTVVLMPDGESGENSGGFIRGIDIYSGGVKIGDDQQELVFVGATSVVSSGIRTTIVVSGLSGNYYTKPEVNALLSTKAPISHNHTHFDIIDWNDAVTNVPAVLANTAKVTNAFHTGEVTGDQYLTITPDAVTMDKIADSSAQSGMVIMYSGGQWIPAFVSVGSGVLVSHAYTHASGAIDPVTPEMIGAATIQVLEIVRSGLTISGVIHNAKIASVSQLGHIRIGDNLTIDGAGVLSAINTVGLVDPMTTSGDLIFRDEDDITKRLPIGLPGQIFAVSGGLPVWRSPSGLFNFAAFTQPGFPGGSKTQIASEWHNLTIGSGLGGTFGDSGDGIITLFLYNTSTADISNHAVTHATYGASGLGHVRFDFAHAQYLQVENGYPEWMGVLVSGAQYVDINEVLTIDYPQMARRLQFEHATITLDPDEDWARIGIGFEVLATSGVVHPSAHRLFFRDGTTAVASGDMVIITAGNATDFIVQTITNGVVDKAPSSDAVFDYFANHNHDDRYYQKDYIDDNFEPLGHTHVAAEITDFDDAVSANPFVQANTAKITNAFHTGEVIGSGYLTIMSGVITPNKLSTAGALDGYTIVYSGGAWHYAAAASVSISSGIIEGGYWDLPGTTIRIRRGSNPAHGTLPSPIAGEMILDYTSGQEDIVVGLSGGTMRLRDATKIRGRNISTSTPTNGQALVWSTSATAWVNGNPALAEDSNKLGGVLPGGYLLAAHEFDIASEGSLGHIKVGSGLGIAPDGTLSVSGFTGGGGPANPAVDIYDDGILVLPASTYIDFRDYFNVFVEDEGVIIDVDYSQHAAVKATALQLGHVRVGDTLIIDGNGVLNMSTTSGMFDPTTDKGDMIYRGDSTIEALPIGASGRVLTVVGGLPSWQPIAAVLSGVHSYSAAFGSYPAIVVSGDINYPIDSWYIERYDGATWKHWGPIFPMVPPPTTGWSWVDQGTATLETAHGGITILNPAGNNSHNPKRMRTLPSAPYTITACITVLNGSPSNNNEGVSLLLRDSSGGKFVTLHTNPFDKSFNVARWNADFSFDSIQLYANNRPIFPHMMWLRVRDDGANRHWYISFDGFYFMELYSDSNTTWCTPDTVGWSSYNGSTTYANAATLISWKVE